MRPQKAPIMLAILAACSFSSMTSLLSTPYLSLIASRLTCQCKNEA